MTGSAVPVRLVGSMRLSVRSPRSSVWTVGLGMRTLPIRLAPSGWEVVGILALRISMPFRPLNPGLEG